MRAGSFDAVVGIGGGRTLDVAKLASTLGGLPMVAVATSLAHDGIASPVASLEEGGRKGSFGVQMPIALVVDLDYVRRSEPEMRRSGIGDVISNLSAIADWQLAGRERGEPVDGVAVTFARTAATSILHRTDGVDDPDFLIALAEALVLSGLAMATAGSSRPCSGGDHEILHAIDQLYPGTARHGELAGAASLFCAVLRDDAAMAADIDACLRRHGLPRTPAELGLAEDQFTAAVLHAPGDAPGPLHGARAPRARRAGGGSACPRVRSGLRLRRCARVAQPPSIFERNSGEHWAGRLYVRRYSARLTRLLIPTRVTPNQLTWLMLAVGLAAAAVLTLPGIWPAVAAVLLIQAQILLDCSDGELARWRQQFSAEGRLPRPARPLRDGDRAADRARHPRRRRLGRRRRHVHDARAPGRGAGADGADGGRAGRRRPRGVRPRVGGGHGGRGRAARRAAAHGAALARRCSPSSARSWPSRRRCWRCWRRSATRSWATSR